MKNLILSVLTLCGALTLTHTTHAAAPSDNEIRFGSVAMDVPATMHRRLSPLTKYLATEIGRPVSLKLAPEMAVAIKDISDNEVELTYLTPVAYIKAAKNGAQLIAKTVTEGKGAFKLMIVVRQDSPIRRIEDLAGKTFAFGDKGAILQRAVVVEAGMPIERLGEYKFIGHYDNIASAVQNGDFAAGIVKDTTAAAWEAKGLRVLHASADLPPYIIAAAKHVDGALLDKFKHAFLKLDARNPAHAEVITALDPQYSGFMSVKDGEYDVVRKLIKPFEVKPGS